MIEERKLAEICEKYKMNCEELIKTNPNILIYGNEQDIIYVLNFLKEELNIDSKNIEKCPSILYFGIDNIKHNYKFLKDKEIRNYDVETCLHILSTEPKDLEATYNYVFKNYGVDYLKQITSILSVKDDRIIDIETNCKELEKMQVLQAAISRRSIEEIKQIVKVCKANGIEPTGTVFLRTAEEIGKIVEVCKANGIEPTGTVFQRTAEEIEQIVEVCKAKDIEPTGNVFLRTAEEIEKIVEVCKANGIELTGSVFKRTAEEIGKIVEVCKANGIEPTGNVFLRTAEEIEQIVEVCKANGIELTSSIFMKSVSKLEECIEYVRKDFGEEYLLPLIVSKNIKTLEKVLPYLKEKGYLGYIKGSASILSLTLEQIKEREKFIEEQGESIIDERGKFNSIFGMSKKNYEKRTSKTQEKNESSRKKDSKSIARAVKDVPITKVREAQGVLNEITNENELEEK